MRRGTTVRLIYPRVDSQQRGQPLSKYLQRVSNCCCKKSKVELRFEAGRREDSEPRGKLQQ